MKLNFIGLLALVAMPLAHAGEATCTEQKPCVDWTMEKLDESSCGLGGDCTVEVCMIVDENLDGCGKSGTFSHMCDQTGADGCAAWTDDTGLVPVMSGDDGPGDCSEDTGAGSTGQVSGKCSTFGYIKMCQEGLPGTTLYWILKDGNDKNLEAVQDYFVTPADTGCLSKVSCVNNLYQCGGGDNQLKMERTWMFEIPASTGNCDICDSPQTEAPVPATEAPVPATEAPVPATEAPVPATVSGSLGDPHFKTWKNEHFEYHGQCDMVLTKDPEFADGMGIDVQIRTKLVRFWSYIQNAAVRIGPDILEVQGSADGEDPSMHYWYNLEYKGEVHTLGGFPIIITRPDRSKTKFVIDLSSKYPGTQIVISTYKEFVRVDVEGATEESFGNAVGLLGDFGTGKTLARDGDTELQDFWRFGTEWQVLPVEPMLFHEVSEPQFPKRCIEPEDPRGERRRRLEENTVSGEQAEAACAKVSNDAADIKDCVYDILATQDLDMVGAY